MSTVAESNIPTGHIDCILPADAFSKKRPYSDSAITFGGSATAFFETHGVDVTGAESSNEYVAKTAADGTVWMVRIDHWLLHAYRERTEIEIEKWNDEINARSFCSWFGSDRLMVCRAIAGEIFKLALLMKPESVPARRGRRALKKRLDVLSRVQWELTVHEKVDMSSVRRRLAGIGIVIHQRTHHEEVHHG